MLDGSKDEDFSITKIGDTDAVFKLNAEMSPQLRAKLQTYRERLRDSDLEEIRNDTVCKIAVLETLLARGEVKMSEATNNALEDTSLKLSPAFPGMMTNAYGVIASYNKGTNKWRVRKGSLPEKGIPDPMQN